MKKELNPQILYVLGALVVVGIVFAVINFAGVGEDPSKPQGKDYTFNLTDERAKARQEAGMPTGPEGTEAQPNQPQTP